MQKKQLPIFPGFRMTDQIDNLGGPAIRPRGNRAKCIFQANFPQESMVYIPAEKSIDGSTKVAYWGDENRSIL